MKTKNIIINMRQTFLQVREQLLQISTDLRGRGQAVFLLQLEFALWLLAAKILVSKNPPGETPIRSLFEELGEGNPTLLIFNNNQGSQYEQ